MDARTCSAKGGRLNNGKCIPRSKSHSTKGKATFLNLSRKPFNPFIATLLIAFLGLSLLLLVNVGTFLHEVAGHSLVAKAFGCEVEWRIDTFTGQMTFSDCALSKGTDTVCSTDFDCSDGKTSTIGYCEDSGYCVQENKAMNIAIALASISVVFFVAIAIWFFLDKDSPWRVLAILMMLYSAIPSSFPMMAGSDMYYAVSQGFPLWLGWTMYVFMSGVFVWLLTIEVTDKRYFKKMFQKRNI